MATGSGTGTPISGTRVRQSLPRTLLSLERYARIMGLNPVHFHQGFDETFFPVDSSCPDVWFKYHWQRPGYASRYDLAVAIKKAEEDIARVLGYWPAPMWIPAEDHKYDKYHRNEYRYTGWMPDVAGRFKSVRTNYGKVISEGKRAVAAAGTSVSVTYTDSDADGFVETATITHDISGSAAETITGKDWFNLNQPCSFGVYHAGQSGDPSWQIRSPRSVTMSGTTITFIFDSWQLLDPALVEEYPQLGGAPNPIDANTLANFVNTVDIYLEYADLSQPSAVFRWAGQQSCSLCAGSGCAQCGDNSRNGCLNIRNREAGVVIPIPAAYDSDSATWLQSTISSEYEPDSVKVWYLAGEVDRDYEMGLSCDPLDDFFAQAIAWLATARLEREPCGCGNAKESMRKLRRDLAIVSPEGNFVIGVDDVLDNPFGTRLGEVRAWRTVARVVGDTRLDGVAI